MKEDTLSEILPQNGEPTNLKPWRTPTVEEMAIDQTEIVVGIAGSGGIIYVS